ncbi:MAG TPA: ABC transporter substrate-binding protein [Candidatus Dormibacteraeota bacterium]
MTFRPAALLLAAVLLAACGGAVTPSGPPPLVVGAIYPLSGPQAEGGKQEFAGVRAALALSHARVDLRVVTVETPAEAAAAVDRLVTQDHVTVIVGTYGSTLADAAAARADSLHVLYWETGAVADGITYGRPWVLRTVATGGTLGRMAVEFASQVLVAKAALVHPTASIVEVDDIYGRSVADAEAAAAAQAGIQVIDRVHYAPNNYDTSGMVARLAAGRPDFLFDVSYLSDGVAIWKSVLAQSWRPVAAIGTSSAFCMPEFGAQLGAGAVGVYAADKPNQAVSPNALDAPARALLARATAEYRTLGGGATMEIPGMAGFVGGWVLFHDVLPPAAGTSSEALRSAALALDIAEGSLINGGGVKFGAPGSSDEGQNLRAASMVAQWQGVQQLGVVYPPTYATAAPSDTSGMSGW